MNEKITEVFKKIKDYILGLSKKMKIIFGAIIGAVIVLAVVLVIILNSSDLVVLYRGLETAECAEIVTKLDEMAVGYEVEDGTTIYVDEKDEPTVKLQLAAEGYPKSSLNYDVFSENVDFMTTDYEKTKYSLFQLQERLQSSIKTLDGVKNAIVTITVPDNSLAVLENEKEKPTASVIIDIGNTRLTPTQITGITLLVAKSVPGLTEDNVSIVDQSGAVLSAEEEDTDKTVSEDKNEMEKKISEEIKQKIIKVLAPLYGEKGLSVGVNAVLDYSKKVTETVEYSPSQDNAGVVNQYDQSYEGAAGVEEALGVPGTSTNADIPTYEVEDKDDDDDAGNIKNDVSVKYSVSHQTEQVEKNGAEIADVTVSVIVDQKVMEVNEIEKITNIVANVAGVKAKNVEVYNTEFYSEDEDVEAPAASGGFIGFFTTISLIGIIIVLIAGIVLLLLLRARKKKKERLEQERLEQEAKEFEIRKKEEEVVLPIDINLQKEEQIKTEIKDFSRKSPEITASLLRTLLKGDID